MLHSLSYKCGKVNTHDYSRYHVTCNAGRLNTQRRQSLINMATSQQSKSNMRLADNTGVARNIGNDNTKDRPRTTSPRQGQGAQVI